ncbi:MAG: N-6 DNA methylase [Candidatus Gracilibacteria bacterium]
MNSDIVVKLKSLVSRFEENESQYVASGSSYNETELRTEFLNEFFQLLGWDILNSKGFSKPFREVVLEANVSEEDKNQKPDYEFRLNGERKFFLEAKRPSVDVLSSKSSVYQARRYGWSAGLSISVLSNFRNLVIYETVTAPSEKDDVRISKIHEFHYKQYVSCFEEIYSLLSKEAVLSGHFDKVFVTPADERRGRLSFDSYFLDQIEKWRILLANDISKNNPAISAEELNYLIQVFINRIVFLRICEDRNLEKYGTLQALDKQNAVKELLQHFYDADKKYNSGLFDFIKDKLTPSVILSNDVLIEIVTDLYYPNSPYAFSVVDPKILGDIYEQFLAKIIVIGKKREINIEYKPEVKIANGVYTTPSFIVREIVHRTVENRISSPEELEHIRIIDIACGSGVFLLEAYSYLLAHSLEFYLKNHKKDKVRKDDYGDEHLTLEAKKEILQNQIFGVDIDERAVEVTKFSLLLKLLEDVSSPEIETTAKNKKKVLPSLEATILCGNSIVDGKYFSYRGISKLEHLELSLVKPFEWNTAFPEVFSNGGFDVIVGNPPYTKIQNMVHYSPQEVGYYQSKYAPYLSSHANNFDKYQLFFERAISLLAKKGCLGFIVPHKFMSTKAGEALRGVVANNKILKELIHFGANQVFGSQATTYTCIIILQNNENPTFAFEKVSNLAKWRAAPAKESMIDISSEALGEGPWVFPSKREKEIIAQIENVCKNKLSDIAEIFVGIQTSADKIFFLNPESEDAKFIYFTHSNGLSGKVEKGILKGSILDQTISPFRSTVSNKQLIFPYEQKDGESTLLTENELKTKYPHAYEYLSRYREKLKARNMPNAEENWYQFGRSQSLNKFGTEKLIIKNPALHACVAFDGNNVFFSGGGNGPYYGVRPRSGNDIFFLIALLNHPIFDKWVKLRSSVFRGGYYSFGKQFIEGFPVKIPVSLDDKKAVKKVTEHWMKIVELNKELGTTPHQATELLRQKRYLKLEADKILSEFYGVIHDNLIIENDEENGDEQ